MKTVLDFSPRRLLALLCLLWCVPLLAQLPPAAIVKTAQPITVDGDPAEWAAQQAAQTVQGRLGQVASYKLAYDAANLYALVTVTDASPLRNSAGVYQELLKGGDAVGLCLGPQNGKGGPQRIMLAQVAGRSEIVAMRPQWKAGGHPYRYFTQAAGAVPMADVSRLDGAGAQAAYATLPTGYRLEVKLPWAALDLQPVPDARIPFDVQVILSDPAGKINVDTAWWHGTEGGGDYCTTDLATEARLYPDTWATAQFYAEDPGPQASAAAGEVDPAFVPRGLPITFTLPHAARVSINIQDNTGWIVRELLRTEKMTSGAHTVYWDGRDRWGAPLPAGKYTYRIGYFDGVKATFAASVGNSARPPYRSDDGLGSIGGQHYGPVALAADSKYLYFLNGGEEGQPCLRCVDPATLNTRWFRGVGGFGMGVAMAADDRYAYMVYNNNGVYFTRLDPANGQPVRFPENRDTLNLQNADVQGLAVVGDTAFFAVPSKNRIGVIDLTRGAFLADIAIPAPRGLCKRDNHTLLVCSGTSVLAIDLTNGAQTPVLTGLTEPAAVTRDAAGAYYISELGALQQVKKYAADGALLATFGVAGGRGMRAVPYNPMAFRNITGLTIGPDGFLWLVESGVPPRRFFKLTTDGKWLEDVYGPGRCGATVGCDLDDPSTIYYGAPNGTAQFVEAKVDYAAYAKSPDPSKGFSIKNIWCLSQNGVDLSAKPDLMADDRGPTRSGYNRMMVFTATNGKRYLWIDGSDRCGIWLWENGNWVPAATVSGSGPTISWSDKNGDGLVQPEECSAVALPAHPSGGWSWIDRNLTLYGIDGTLATAAVDARGVPTYQGGAFTPHLTQNSAFSTLFDGLAYWAAGAPATSEQHTFYYTENAGPHQNRDFWDRSSENRIVKVKDGKVQWIVGRHNGVFNHDGDDIMCFGVTGETDGMVITSDVNSNFVAYTSDGLALGWVLTDANGQPSGQAGPNAIYVENAAPNLFIKDAKTGKHLLVTHTTEDVRVMEITGGFTNDVTRIDGTLTLASSLPRPTATQPGVMTIPYRTWYKSLYEVWRPTNVDAFDYEWAPDLPALTLTDAQKTVLGEVRLRRDAGNLCLYAELLDPNPVFALPGVKTPVELFGKGSGLELLLGRAENPQRTLPVAGDTRLFLSAVRAADGRLQAQVLACRPASPAVPPSQELSEMGTTSDYRTKGTTAAWDSSQALTPVPGAMVAMRDRYDGRGYVIEAEIPLAAFPELSKVTSQSYWHAAPNGQGDGGHGYTNDRSDLQVPLKLNVATWRRNAAGVVTRLPWKADGYTGADPTKMNPSAWGVVTEPPSVALTVAKAGQPDIPVTYVATNLTRFGFGGGPTVRVDRNLFGGGWYDLSGKLTFLTTAPRLGFALDVPAGGQRPVNDNVRTAKLDMTNVGLPNLTSLARRTDDDKTPIATTLRLAFPAGHGGKLHILWGTYTDNSPGGGALSITDAATGQTIDAATHPELSFAVNFNQEFAACETVLTVGGTRTLNITLKDTAASSRACLQGIWIEPLVQSSFPLPAALTLAAYPGATVAAISRVEFYQGSTKIGEATRAPYVFTWQPATAGAYTLRARVIDKLGATADSLPQTITINAAH